MQQNIDCITKEVFDLQETINWKDKKIGVWNKYIVNSRSRQITLFPLRNAVYSKEMKATPSLNIHIVLQSVFLLEKENELHFIFTCIMVNNTKSIT